MISKNQFAIAYPYLARFAKETKKEDGSLLKGGAYIGSAGYAAKTGVDSGLTRLLGARLERHSTSREAAKKIMSEGGFLDASKGVRKSMRLISDTDDLDPFSKILYKETFEKSQGKNFISGFHPLQTNKSIWGFVDEPAILLPKNPLRDVFIRRAQAHSYRAQSEIDFDKYLTRSDRTRQANKNLIPAMIGKKGKTLFAPVTDKEVLEKFVPDVDDPLALMTGDRVKVYSNRMSALLGHLKKNGLNQIKANPGRVAAGAAILGGAGAIATHLARKGFAEVKAFRRKGKLVKAHKRKISQ